MMSNPSFTKIPDRGVEPIETDLEGWEKISGAPKMKTWIEYTADDGSVISGWWEATRGTYKVCYSAWEFVHLIEGAITITPDGGQSYTVGPGDAFIVEKDFEGIWEIEEQVLKHFVIRLK